jgi:hypothetical protein
MIQMAIVSSLEFFRKKNALYIRAHIPPYLGKIPSENVTSAHDSDIFYDFNHPTMGCHHTKMFRDESQHTADFLEYHIKGRLHRAKARIAEQGLWAGHQVKVGFICDIREKLLDGSRNPNHRQYVVFTPCAEVMREYFKLFKRINRNLSQTFAHIEQR